MAYITRLIFVIFLINLQLVKLMQLEVLIGLQYHKNIQSYYDANILTNPTRTSLWKLIQ